MSQFESKSDAPEQGRISDANPTASEGGEESFGEFSTTPAAPRNNAVLIFLALVVIGAGAVMFMRLRAGPKAAVASPESATAKTTINQFLTEGDKNIKAMRELLKNTEKIVQQFVDYPAMTQVKVEDLKTNPFQFASTRPAQTSVKVKPDTDKQDAVEAIKKLKIQTILVSGVSRSCMINNTIYREGQDVGILTIEKINPNSIIFVSPGGHRFEVNLRK